MHVRNSLVNSSPVMYAHRLVGWCSMKFLHSPWSRCVLPSPQLPWMNSGLYCTPGNSATYAAALYASWFDAPITNVPRSCRSRGFAGAADCCCCAAIAAADDGRGDVTPLATIVACPLTPLLGR